MRKADAFADRSEVWLVASVTAGSAFLDSVVAALYSLVKATLAFFIGGLMMFWLALVVERLKVRRER